jgi:UDP-N-acetylmuramoyl-tripeptide--D-alanyl-D-alanine ligase
VLKIEDILAATGGRIVNSGFSYADGCGFRALSIDSRTIEDGELFIAIKGEKFDGHDFISAALHKCGGVIADSEEKIRGFGDFNKPIILVQDTISALHDIARYLRRRFEGQVIAVIGSNGKTTTKELLASIMATKYSIIKTGGNFNNNIGMPLSMINGLSSEKTPDVMVLEMGTNRPGDIMQLCEIGMPETGVITNIGYEHIEGFGSLKGVMDSELEILPFIKKAVVNMDDTLLMEGMSNSFKGSIVSFAINSDNADITAKNIESSISGISFDLYASGQCIEIRSGITGYFNVYNCLAAAAAAYSCGVGLQDIKNGIEAFGGVDMRFQVREVAGAVFIYDVYNANPSSMQESVKELSRLFKTGGGNYKRAVAVLGDMLELGDYALEAHLGLGRMLSEKAVDLFVGVGTLMSYAVGEFKGISVHFDDSHKAADSINGLINKGDIVLIKGSRGMKMERIMEAVMSGCAVADGAK